MDQPQAANSPVEHRHRLRFTAEENATLGAVALIMGLASAYAQFLGSRIHGWLLLIAACLLLTALTVGAVILVKRVRTISLPWALLIVAFAAVSGAGAGYLIRGSSGSTNANPASPAGSRTTAPSADEDTPDPSGRPSETTIKGPSMNATTFDGSGSGLGGRFENFIPRSTGCMTDLHFVINQGLPSNKRIWVMVYNSEDQSEVYPERKHTFANGRGSVAPFPLGSEADPEGTEFEVLGVLLDVTTSDRYEKQAESSGTLPVETKGPPGRVLDHFSVTRGKAYAACT